MKRVTVAVLVGVLSLTACTSDDEPDPDAASPSASATDEGSDAGGSEPDDEASPTPSASPTEDDSDAGDATDGDTASGGDSDASDGADADGGEGNTDEGDATDGTDADAGDATDGEPETDTGAPGGPATDTPSTPVSYDAAGSAFVEDTSRSRRADFTAACFVVAEGETITECVKAYSDVNDAWMSLVEATEGDRTTVTLYRYDGTGFTSALSVATDSPDVYALSATDWQNAEDLFRASTGAATDLLAWDRAGAPRVVAQVPASGDYTYTAQRVVRRTSAGVEVLAVSSSGSGLAGSRTAAGSEEDVALRVYRAWVRGDRAAAAPHATDEVLTELFDNTPAPNDSYALDGTDCPASGTQVACGFTARFDGRTVNLTWTLGTVDGALKVVKLS